MDDKTRAKLEKKRIKEQAKVLKKQSKYEVEKAKPENGLSKIHEASHKSKGSAEEKTDNEKPVIQVVMPQEEEKPWYKNPSWIRAISGVIIMIIVLITFIMTYYR
jgi:hypothetical protein